MTDRHAVIQSIVVGSALLRALAEVDHPLALKHVAARAQMYPSKAHRYLASFVETGLVVQDPTTRHYSLGPLARQLGLSALRAHRPIQIARSVQAELRELFNETFVLSVWGNTGPVIVQVDESSRAVVMTMRTGAVLPTLTTATGLVFSAYLPHYVAAQAIDVARRGPASKDRQLRVLDRVREAGFAYNSGHLTPGASALALPIFDHMGTVVAVTAAVGQDVDIDPAQHPRLLEAMSATTTRRR